MTKWLGLPLVILVSVYVSLIFPMSRYLTARPIAVKLGLPPDARAIKMVAGDQRYLVANILVSNVLFYYGTLLEKDPRNITKRPEYFSMFKTLENVVKIDPYNMDAYYFTQAAFTWEVGRAGDVNKVLAYGMRFRDWDYQLPFFAGFNAAYFLKDYAAAAKYMQRAAELSDNPLFTTLASRYFYEAGEHELGILFLDTMVRGARDDKVRKSYQMRLDALQAVNRLDNAIKKYVIKFGSLPKNPDQLVSAGFIQSVPADPYGGTFYLDEHGKVLATSGFVTKNVIRH